MSIWKRIEVLPLIISEIVVCKFFSAGTFQKFGKYLTRKRREALNRQMQSELTNRDFSIISENCVGGFLYHDLGLRFLSPTINMFFSAEGFIKLLENPSFYFSQSLKIIRSDDYHFPLGILGDVTVYLAHFDRDYRSNEECVNKWNERVQRINWDNLFIIATDRDGMTSELMERFDKLPYKKIMYVSKPVRYDWAVYLPQFKNKPCVGLIMGIANFKGERYYETKIDLINWINNGIISKPA